MKSCSCSTTLAALAAIALLAGVAPIASAEGALSPPGAVRELVDMRTATSKHWLNADGTRTAVISAGPVHYQDIDGEWKDIDLTLGPAARADAGFSVTKNPVKVHLAGSADGIQTIESGEISLSFAPVGARPVAGVVSGSSITYPDAWPGVDLRYTVLTGGLKEEIILSERPLELGYSFLIRPCGLSASRRSDGSVALLGEPDVPTITISAPFMYDSTGRHTREVELRYEENVDGSIAVRVIPNADWLAGAKYPVVIDPTIVVEDQEQNVSIDKYFWHYNGPNGYWYDNGILQVGHYLEQTEEDFIDSYWHTCIKFSMYGIPACATITDAQMQFTRCSDSSTGGQVRVYRIISNPWPANLMPDLGYTVLASREWSTDTLQVFADAALTSVVQNWHAVEAHNFGAALVGGTGWPTNYFAKAYSSETAEAADRPKLLVTYTHPKPQMLTVTDDGDYTTSTAELHASWTADADSTCALITAYSYAIGTEPGDTSVTGGWLSPSPLTSTSVTKTGLTLSNGETYYFTVKAKNSDEVWSEPLSSDGITVDTAPPTVTIDTPPGDELHLAPGATVLTFSGRAIDTGCGVASVEVSTDGGVNWDDDVDYDAETFVWTYDWHPQPIPSTVTLCVKATDNVGNETDPPVCRLIHIYNSAPDVCPVIYVDANVATSGDGSSWDEAVKTLQEAWAIAASDDSPEVTPNEIWVADGLYTAVYGNSVQIPVNVSLFGGFRGKTPTGELGESAREQRNWEQNLSDMYLWGGTNVEAPTSSWGVAAGFTPVIDGFLIRNGEVGLACDLPENDLIISHNRIEENGCGIKITYGDPGATVQICNNWITNNRSTGIDCYAYWGDSSGIVIGNNTITDNGSDPTGSNACGVALNSYSPTIVDNIIAGNACGIQDYGDGGSQPLVKNNCFHQNGQSGSEHACGFSYSLFQVQGNTDNLLDTDPELDGVHIALDSPCVDAGFRDGGTIYEVALNELDFDGQPRVMPSGGDVDIGADEVSGQCERVAVSANATSVPWGDPVTISASVVDTDGDPVSGRKVVFSVTGHGSLSPTLAETVSGVATTTLTDDCVETVIVTAAIVDECGKVSSDTVQVEFCPDTIAISASPANWAACGEGVSLTATVTKSDGVSPRVGVEVTWLFTEPLLTPDPDPTDENRNAYAAFACSKMPCPPDYYPYVTATTSDECANEVTAGIWLGCGGPPPLPPADVVFVLDISSSMQFHEASCYSIGTVPQGPGSVQALVRAVSAVRPSTRFGAVFFSDDSPIPPADQRSISQFTGQNAVDDFCDWAMRAWDPSGATTAQEAALNAAASALETYSPFCNRRFVVFVTDDFMYTVLPSKRLALARRLDALTGPNGGGVFVSLWEAWQGQKYSFYSQAFTSDPGFPSLAVNGGFDHTSFDTKYPADERYLFDALSDRILYGPQRQRRDSHVALLQPIAPYLIPLGASLQQSCVRSQQHSCVGIGACRE